jgi:hypothetical protein
VGSHPLITSTPQKNKVTLPPDVTHFGRLYEFVWSIVVALDRVKENIERQKARGLPLLECSRTKNDGWEI